MPISAWGRAIAQALFSVGLLDEVSDLVEELFESDEELLLDFADEPSEELSLVEVEDLPRESVR
jgi:hypothetical protein